jgi:hypothetical protein
MASLYLDIDLNDINTHELIEEVSNRALILTDSNKQDLLEAIAYADAEKWKWFLAVKDKFSLHELQEKFNCNEVTVISKDQLTIPFNDSTTSNEQ